MSWNSYLEALCKHQEYGLTPLEIEVILCIKESQDQTKNDLRAAYIDSYAMIEEEAFTQRLKNIYKKFNIIQKGHKLPQLRRFLVERYIQYRNKDVFFSEIGLTDIHSEFPRDNFGKAIDRLLDLDRPNHQCVDILQTFAPNLDDYSEHLFRCLKNNVQVRILLAWPYSEAAKLREDVLRKYSNREIEDDINVRDCVTANLETLEKIISISDNSECLEIRLYDTLPSLAIYRAGDYMLAAPFLHGALAVNTFQLELKLEASNPILTHTLRQDFELMWQVARPFYPELSRNWRNDLKILFSY